MTKTWFMYAMECENGQLYTGITNDIERRFKEHQRKGSHFTSYNPAIRILHKEIFQDQQEAARREKQIKGWTKAKKIALANNDLVLLKKL